MTSAVAHAWLRRVSDYASGDVAASERAAVEAHIATCAECQRALVAYRRFDALVRTPLRLGDGGAGALPGYAATSRRGHRRTSAFEHRHAIEERAMITNDSNRETSRTPPVPLRRPRATLTTLGAIAAVLLIAILAGVLFAHFRGPTQPVTPHPTVTPTVTVRPTATVATLNTPLPNQGWVTVPELAIMRNLAFATSDPLTGYACGANVMVAQTPTDVLQLSVTHDGGRTWSGPTATTVPGATCDFSIDPNNANDLVMQAWHCYNVGCTVMNPYRSHDGGKTWTKLEFDATQWQAPGQTNGGGQVWWQVSQPAWIGATAYFAVVVPGAHGPIPRPQHPMVSNSSGSVLSAVGDGIYTMVTDSQTYPGSVWTLGTRLVFSTDSSLVPEAESSDGGITWQRFTPTLEGATGPVNSFGLGHGPVAVINGSLARSINGGASWQLLPAVAVEPSAGGVNLPFQPSQLYQAADGTTWLVQVKSVYRLAPGATAWNNVATRPVDTYGIPAQVLAFSTDTSGHPLLIWSEASRNTVSGVLEPGVAYHAVGE